MLMKVDGFTRSGKKTLCFLEIKRDMVFVGCGEHEDEAEAQRLAYEDALEKAKVISIRSLAFYRSWKRQKGLR